MMTIFFATAFGSLLGCRLAYGSWPWEARKTWHWTKDEIQYLRDVQLESHRNGLKAEPNWPYGDDR